MYYKNSSTVFNKKLLLILFQLLFTSLFAQNFDIDLLRNINQNRNRNFDKSVVFVTNTATPLSIGVPCVMLGTALIKKDKKLLKEAIYVSASELSSLIIYNTIKYSVNRERPFVTYPDIEKLSEVSSPSFPSGHTSSTFSLATSLSLTYPKWYVIVPSYLWATSVAYTRMAAGVHYPSDIIAGAIIGSGSAFLCSKLQKWFMEKRIDGKK